jgi:hypothetical protein
MPLCLVLSGNLSFGPEEKRQRLGCQLSLTPVPELREKAEEKAVRRDVNKNRQTHRVDILRCPCEQERFSRAALAK